jgi:hypothetical protein
MITPSKFDNDTFLTTREHLNSFINRVAKEYGGINKKLLEIGPQDRSEVKVAFNGVWKETLTELFSNKHILILWHKHFWEMSWCFNCNKSWLIRNLVLFTRNNN